MTTGDARARGRSAGARLSRSADFDRVYRKGSSRANRALVVYAFPRGDGEPARIGLSVSRKVGGAVARNRVKRVLREAFAAARESVDDGVDIVVVARPEAGELAEREGLSGLEGPLRELLEGAGVVHGGREGER